MPVEQRDPAYFHAVLDHIQKKVMRVRDEQSRWWPWQVCVFLLFATALSYLDRQALSIAAPVIRQEMKLDNAQLGLLLSAFFYAYSLMHLGVGWVLDRFNIRDYLSAVRAGWSVAQASRRAGGRIRRCSRRAFSWADSKPPRSRGRRASSRRSCPEGEPVAGERADDERRQPGRDHRPGAHDLSDQHGRLAARGS